MLQQGAFVGCVDRKSSEHLFWAHKLQPCRLMRPCVCVCASRGHLIRTSMRGQEYKHKLVNVFILYMHLSTGSLDGGVLRDEEIWSAGPRLLWLTSEMEVGQECMGSEMRVGYAPGRVRETVRERPTQ